MSTMRAGLLACAVAVVCAHTEAAACDPSKYDSDYHQRVEEIQSPAPTATVWAPEARPDRRLWFLAAPLLLGVALGLARPRLVRPPREA